VIGARLEYISVYIPSILLQSHGLAQKHHSMGFSDMNGYLPHRQDIVLHMCFAYDMRIVRREYANGEASETPQAGSR